MTGATVPVMQKPITVVHTDTGRHVKCTPQQARTIYTPTAGYTPLDTQPAPPAAAPTIDSMTVAQLKDHLERAGTTYPAGATKPQLIALAQNNTEE